MVIPFRRSRWLTGRGDAQHQGRRETLQPRQHPRGAKSARKRIADVRRRTASHDSTNPDARRPHQTETPSDCIRSAE
jgi:hypothetical protein